MDRATLDALIARLASGATRRVAVKGLVGGALASVGALAETAAKGKSKKKRKGDGKGKGKGKKRGHGKHGSNGNARKGGKQRGTQDDRDVGGQTSSQGGDDGTDASGTKSKRCKKNGRNCGARGSADQQLSAV